MLVLYAALAGSGLTGCSPSDLQSQTAIELPAATPAATDRLLEIYPDALVWQGRDLANVETWSAQLRATETGRVVVHSCLGVPDALLRTVMGVVRERGMALRFAGEPKDRTRCARAAQPAH